MPPIIKSLCIAGFIIPICISMAVRQRAKDHNQKLGFFNFMLILQTALSGTGIGFILLVA